MQINSNAQDFSANGAKFTYFVPTVLSQLAPPTGPAQGDTRITLYGNFSALGSLYACQFDEDEPAVDDDTTHEDHRGEQGSPFRASARLLADGADRFSGRASGRRSFVGFGPATFAT